MSSRFLRRVVWCKFTDVSYLWKVGKVAPNCTWKQHRRQTPSYSPPLKPQITINFLIASSGIWRLQGTYKLSERREKKWTGIMEHSNEGTNGNGTALSERMLTNAVWNEIIIRGQWNEISIVQGEFGNTKEEIVVCYNAPLMHSPIRTEEKPESVKPMYRQRVESCALRLNVYRICEIKFLNIETSKHCEV